MNYEMVIEELRKWDEDEKFYRDFYHFTGGATRSNEELKQFFEEQKPQQSDIDIVLHPSEIQSYKTEELFFTGDRNVMLIKHPRYTPYLNISMLFLR